MLINEVTEPASPSDGNLVTALQLLKSKYSDGKSVPKISTQSLINLILNTDKNFNYDSLVQSAENNPAVKNLIKSYNKDYVILRLTSDAENVDATTTLSPTGSPQQQGFQLPVDDVSSMAKRAAKQRGAAV
jgi:hypothetical protein